MGMVSRVDLGGTIEYMTFQDFGELEDDIGMSSLCSDRGCA